MVKWKCKETIIFSLMEVHKNVRIKNCKKEAIAIPARIAKKLSLRDGMIVEAKVEKGKLLILGRKNKIKNIMKYAGIWEDVDVDSVFREIRKDWHKWQKSLSA